MQKKILKNNMLIRLITAILTVNVCLLVFLGTMKITMQQQAVSQAKLLADILDNEKGAAPAEILSEIDEEIDGRITFVSSYGKVIFDSEFYAADMDSHADRTEIIRALDSGIGTGQRYSDTEKKIMYYCAVRTLDKQVIRVGVTASSVMPGIILKIVPFIITGITLVILLAFFISKKTTIRIVDTIENYDIDSGNGEIYEELSDFVGKIKSQNEIINRQLKDIDEEKTKFQNIFVNIREGIVVCDQTEKIIQANREARTVFSLTELPIEFSKAIDINELSISLASALSGQTVHCVFEKDGRHFYRTLSPNYSEDSAYSKKGETECGAVIVITDITRQRESEKDRRQFTDNVTHELKTPLTNILGYSQLILNGMAKEEDIKKFADIVENSAANLLEMINDIIKISNLESGYGFEKEMISLDETVKDALESEIAPAKALGVEINFSSEKVDVLADENRIYLLIHNLVSNAVKYNKPGGKVDIALQEEGEFAVLSVSDTGIGILPQHLEKIFERFYVVDKARNKNTSSTGLGLAIVKHVVKAHNGYITVKSTPGKGSIFTVKLPLT